MNMIAVTFFIFVSILIDFQNASKLNRLRKEETQLRTDIEEFGGDKKREEIKCKITNNLEKKKELAVNIADLEMKERDAKQ